METAADVYRKPVVYRVDGMDRVDVRRNVRYRADADVVLDVYRPRADSRARAAIVFVHGGVPPETSPKDWGVFTSYGRIAAASGFVGVAINYRNHQWRPEGAPQPGAMATASDDVRQALAYVCDHAAEIGVDPNRIVVWVFSMGGPAVSFLFHTPPAAVRALVAYYAPLVDDAGMVTAAGVPFTVIVARAGQDHPRLNAAIDGFVAASLTGNASIEVYNHPTGRHGFDIVDDDNRSRDIIERTFAGIRTACLPDGAGAC